MFTEVWQSNEDCSLIQIVKELGTESWSKASQIIRTKTAAQCKFRYQYICSNPIYFKQISDLERSKFPRMSISQPPAPRRGRPPLHSIPRQQFVIDESEKENMDPETRKKYESSCEKFNSLLNSSKIVLNNNVCDWEEWKDRSLCDQIISKGKYDWETIEGSTTSAFPQFCKLRWGLLGLGPIDCSFSAQEDSDLVGWVENNGENCWDKATQKITCRSQKQCELRYKYLQASGKILGYKRAKKCFMKELEDCNDRYNFDRLLDNVNTKSMKDYKQLFDLDCLNSVLDMEQKMQLKRASDKAGNNKISSKINLTKKQKVPDTSRIVNSSHDQIVEPKWTIQENQILFKAHKILGHNWTKISSLFPSRFPRSIKAHFLEVLRCISGKFSKRPVTENDRFKGYSYQPRDETEVLQTLPSDRELQDYVPLMYKLLKIEEVEISKVLMDKISQIKSEPKAQPNVSDTSSDSSNGDSPTEEPDGSNN